MIKLCQWDITGACNLNCAYCREKQTAGLNHLELSQILPIVDQFAEASVQRVCIAGGEPLTLPFLGDVLAYMNGKVEKIAITTNGTLITERNVDTIKKHCNAVQVSLDGSKAEFHDRLRGSGTFIKTVRGIKILINSGVRVVTRFTICRPNVEDISDYIRFAHSLGASAAYVRRCLPAGNYANVQPFSAPELFEIYKQAYSVGQHIGIRVGSSDYFSQLFFDPAEMSKAEESMRKRPGQVVSGCSIGIDAFFLAQDGKILFCPYLPVFCGDLTKEKLVNVWQHSQMFKVCRNLRWNLEGKCANCRWKLCCGGCPAYAYLTTGKITGSDNGCWVDDPV